MRTDICEVKDVVTQGPVLGLLLMAMTSEELIGSSSIDVYDSPINPVCILQSGDHVFATYFGYPEKMKHLKRICSGKCIRECPDKCSAFGLSPFINSIINRTAERLITEGKVK